MIENLVGEKQQTVGCSIESKQKISNRAGVIKIWCNGTTANETNVTNSRKCVDQSVFILDYLFRKVRETSQMLPYLLIWHEIHRDLSGIECESNASRGTPLTQSVVRSDAVDLVKHPRTHH